MKTLLWIARILLMAYVVIMSWFGISEGVPEGTGHWIIATLPVLALVLFWNKPMTMARVLGVLFILTLFLLKTYDEALAFSTISLPLGVASVLYFLVDMKGDEPRVVGND